MSSYTPGSSKKVRAAVGNDFRPRAPSEQHRLEGQQHQQLTAPDNNKRKTHRAEAAGLRSVAAACERGY